MSHALSSTHRDTRISRWLRGPRVSSGGTELRSILDEENSSETETGDTSGGESRQKLWEKLRRFSVASLLVLTITFAASAESLVGPFLPIQAAEKGSSPLTTGIIIGASPFFLVTLSPVIGYYLPKLGVKLPLVSGILMVGGAFFLLGFLTYMPPGAVFVVFGILLGSIEGVGWAMGKTTILALLPSLYPSHIGLISGLILGFESVGETIGPPIASLLVSVSDYCMPFWIAGGIILILVPPAFLLVKTPESLSTKVLPLHTILKLLSHKRFSMLLLANITTYSSLTFMDVTLALYLHKIGLSELQIGVTFGITSGSYVISTIPVGKLSDMFGTRIFIISGLFMEAASLIFMGIAPNIPLPQWWIVVSSLLFLGCSVSQIDIPVYSDLLKQAHSLHLTTEEEKDALTSTVSGIINFSMSLGELIGALLGGLLTHLTDFSTAVLILGEAVAANALLILGVSLIDYIHENYFLRT